MYSQLMVAAHKAESKNEEAQDKVWARSAMTTNPVEGDSETGKPNSQANGCPNKSRAG